MFQFFQTRQSNPDVVRDKICPKKMKHTKPLERVNSYTMVLTRSMMKTQGLTPIVLPLVKEFTKNVEQHPRIMHFKELEPITPVVVLAPTKTLKTNWPYYALFVPAFMYCAYYKSGSGLVWVSLLSQAVHYMVNRIN